MIIARIRMVRLRRMVLRRDEDIAGLKEKIADLEDELELGRHLLKLSRARLEKLAVEALREEHRSVKTGT